MKYFNLFCLTMVFCLSANGAELKTGDTAPTFKIKNQLGQDFDLSSRKGHWTVLYFYPKSETPGCTQQACAFRDNIKKVRSAGAELFGVSINSVQDQAGFRERHHLGFDLLADEDGKITDLYGAKMRKHKMANRWTFILDPDLKIRAIDKNEDPVKNADHVVAKLKELQGK